MSFMSSGPSTLALAVALGLLCMGCDEVTSKAESEPSLRHGEPGVRPFWNAHAGRYIYPPGFDVADTTDKENTYRVVAANGGFIRSAPLLRPWSSVAPIWRELPAGNVSLRLEGISDAGDTSLVREIRTIRSPGFARGVAVAPDNPAAAGMAGLEAVLELEKVRHWIDPGGPYPGYQLWVHPSKLMGVLSQGMLFLAQQTQDARVSTDAKKVAIATAEFLLTLREPPGAPLAGWTHSYWDGVERGEHPIYMDQVMTLYPSEAAMAFLDLYDETGDRKWWDAAVDIADTYRDTQRPDGTWYLLLSRDTGEPPRDKLLVPVSVILFFDRLSDQYGAGDYTDVRSSAFDWVMDNPVKTFAWEAQFEDTRPKARYRNLSHREASGFARLLFATMSDDAAMLALAEELMLFVEDQFVIWTHEDAVTRTNWFKDGSKWNGDVEDGGKDWFLPAVLEQYAFYTPIAGTTSNVIHAYCAAYEATGEETYRDKARALTRSLVDAQEYHGGGEIPTHLRKTLPEENWLNNSVYSARTLVDASCL